MTLAQEKVEALIHGIYEAATAPDRWPDALKGVGEAINSSSASALWFDGTRNSLLRGDGWNVDPEAIDLYGRYYVTICPRLRRSRLFHAGDCYDDRVLRERPSPTDREYFAFMDSHGHSLARTLLAERDAGMRMGLTFYGPNYDDPGGEALRLLSALAPHVRRASHLTLRLMEATERAEFGDDLFEMSSAMLLLGSGGAVRRINGRAEAILAVGDGLRLVAGHLCAATPADDERLQQEIGAALAPTIARGNPPDGVALVSRPSGKPAWAVSALPFPPRLRDGFASVPPRALVTIAETVPRASPARLRRGFGLSQAEAEVAAALASGLHLDEIAHARHASLETVRAQLKSIFGKLDVSTQAQLVGRVASLCGLPPPPPPN